MARFQLIACTINVGGDRDNTVVRDQFDPITIPEMLVLQAVHGGIEHVHTLAAVGYDERNPDAERERLELKYGKPLVGGLFPGAMSALPLEDVSIATLDEIDAGTKAAAAARKAVRNSGKTKAEPEPKTKPVVPDLVSGQT